MMSDFHVNSPLHFDNMRPTDSSMTTPDGAIGLFHAHYFLISAGFQGLGKDLSRYLCTGLLTISTTKPNPDIQIEEYQGAVA